MLSVTRRRRVDWRAVDTDELLTWRQQTLEQRVVLYVGDRETPTTGLQTDAG